MARLTDCTLLANCRWPGKRASLRLSANCAQCFRCRVLASRVLVGLLQHSTAAEVQVEFNRQPAWLALCGVPPCSVRQRQRPHTLPSDVQPYCQFVPFDTWACKGENASTRYGP